MGNVLPLGPLQEVRKKTACASVQQKIFIGMISKGSRLPCLPSPKPTVYADGTRGGAALAQQAEADIPEPFTLHPVCPPVPTASVWSSQTCS